MWDYIPDDLLPKVLAYLPPKSLVRFTCICKSWKSLITSSVFISDHLNQTKLSNDNDGKHLILIRYDPGKNEKERYSLRIDNHTLDQYDAIEFPFLRSGYYKYFRVLGSCNGLICLSAYYGPIINTVLLWNPSIRKCLTLPLPNFTCKAYGPLDHAVIGFGFDSRTNDYKVVRIVYFQSERGHSPKVEIYKLSTGYWETITATVDPSCFASYTFSTQAFINGAVHWPAYKRDTGALIMSFGMNDDLFHEMRSPAGVMDKHFVNKMHVAVCGEWLSSCHYNTEYIYHLKCSVWVMKEYGVVESWTKLYNVDIKGGLGNLLGFRSNGEILLTVMNRELVSYKPETRKMKYLGIFESDSFHVDTYVESLVLLEHKQTWE